MGTSYNTQLENGSFVEEGTVSQAKWQNRNEQIMSYVKVSLAWSILGRIGLLGTAWVWVIN